jgi:hypothetical protein
LVRAGELLERTSRAHRDGWVRASAVCARAALFSAALRAQIRAPTAAGFDAQRQAELAARRLGDFEHWLERATEDREARVRCAVAMSLRHLPAPQALRVGRALSADPCDAVRTAQIEAWEELACTAAVQALIARLDHESVARVRTQIALSLQRLSGFKHRDDPRPWRDWAKGLAADWKPTLLPASGAAAASGNAAGGVGGEARSSARASFGGLALLSSRICFAIDFSGSMWTPMPDGRLPKELVDARLRATLESLPASTHFNIVVFTNEVIPWRPKLVPAQPFQVRSAIADFERCQERGRGNFFDAAVFALDDPEVDTLLTLSDGVPTGGFHSHLDRVIPLLLERNRFRRVAFDTVLVDAPSAAERRWRVLSDRSGGRLVSTEKAE